MQRASGKNPTLILHLTSGFPKTNKTMKLSSLESLIYLKWHRFGNNWKNFVEHFTCKFLGVCTRSKLGEPGVVFQGRNNADQISLVKMFKVSEAKFMGVVGKVDCVNVPGNLQIHANSKFVQNSVFSYLLPIWHIIVITVASILGGKPTTRTHIFEI